MTLSTKILLSYLALGGGVGGIYIGVNGGIGNKAIEEVVEEVAEPVNTPDVVAQPPAPEKTEEHAEEKDKGVGTEETLEVKETKVNEEMKESTANGEGVGQDTDIELRVVEAATVPTVEIQVAQAVPEIKYQKLQVEANPPAPEETKENVVSAPIEVPASNQITPKTEETPSGTSNSSGEEKTGMAWIMGKAQEYADQRQQLTTIIRAVKSYLG